ncbi:MAG: response regulator [Planctomycetes bacterium]|nr:response regulator [Planctomycetota bacterium]
MANILIIDDDDSSRALLISLLRTAGHHSYGVPDGREALRSADYEPPDLILCDVLMPLMDGVEVLRQLRHLRQSGMPVVAVTGLADSAEERDRLLATGFDGCYSKPLNIRTFAREMEQYLPPVWRGHAPPAPPVEAPAAAPPPGPSDSVFDRPAALAGLGDDAPYLDRLTSMFLIQWPGQRGDLRAAVAARDPDATHRRAQALKGNLAAIGARSGSAAAARLDEQALTGSMDSIERLLDAVEREVDRFAAAARVTAGRAPGAHALASRTARTRRVRTCGVNGF